MPLVARHSGQVAAPQEGSHNRAARAEHWPLFIAAVLFPFANGAQCIWLAAWLAPIFLLRFTRRHRLAVVIPVTLLVQVVACALQFRGMMPYPLQVRATIILVYSVSFAVPYIGDRLLISNLVGFPRSLVFPLLWASTEFLMSFGPFGSWCSIPYSQSELLSLIQVVSVTGLYGVTFLIGWFAAAANAFWEEWGESYRLPRVGIASLLLVVSVVLVGGLRLSLFPPGAETVRIASLSKLDQEVHPVAETALRFKEHSPLTNEEIETVRLRTVAASENLLARAEHEAQAGAKIIFWGEGNALIVKEDEGEVIRRGKLLATKYGVYLAMAVASWHLETTPHLENKIVMITPEGQADWQFLKANPVPGREATISMRGDGKMQVSETPYGRLSGIICFDADFPRLLAQTAHLKTDIVLDPSNDWREIDPYHTRMAAFRAIEQGVNLVRHTSHGLSAAFDYQGRQLASMDHFVTNDRDMVAQVPTRGTRTLYSMKGDWFPWTCVTVLSLLVFSAISRSWRVA
jgi:apolipoprotein N-acyltransferase